MTELHFIVRAAVSEETNNGWVWVQTPCDTRVDSELTPRTIVTIKQKGEPCWSCIYVEVRKIDDNFRKQYNCKASTVSICQKKMLWSCLNGIVRRSVSLRLRRRMMNLKQKFYS